MPCAPAPLDPAWGPVLESLWHQLAPRWPGVLLEAVASTGSTNADLRDRARAWPRDADLPPILRVAERQTAGRGRQGRRWTSDTGPQARTRALTFSLAWTLPEPLGAGLAPALGLALAEALPEAVALKWPNDLWVDDRKLGGLLIETLAARPGRRVAVIGLGLNLRAPPSEPDAVPGAADPVGLEALGPAWAALDAPAVLARLVPPLVEALAAWPGSGWAAWAPRWPARDALRDRRIRLRVAADQPPLEGWARGLDEDAALRLETPAGLRRLASAEVTQVRPC